MRVQTIESMEEIFEEMKEFSYIMKGAENEDVYKRQLLYVQGLNIAGCCF